MEYLATSLNAALNRAIHESLETIAKDGLVALRDLLAKEGFYKSEYLKDHDVFSHVTGNTITFEIVLDFESVEAGDEQTKQALAEGNSQALNDAEKSYGLSFRTARRIIGMRDMRQPARDARRDARKPARDIRKTYQSRLIGHESAKYAPRNVVIPQGIGAPRSANVTQSGKLSVAFQRSIRENESGFRMPAQKFEGIIGRFLKKLEGVIQEKFYPELTRIIQERI